MLFYFSFQKMRKCALFVWIICLVVMRTNRRLGQQRFFPQEVMMLLVGTNQTACLWLLMFNVEHTWAHLQNSISPRVVKKRTINESWVWFLFFLSCPCNTRADINWCKGYLKLPPPPVLKVICFHLQTLNFLKATRVFLLCVKFKWCNK